MMTKPSYLPLKRECEVAAFLPLPCNNASSSPPCPIVLYSANCQIIPFSSSIIHHASTLTPNCPLHASSGLTILAPQRIYPQPIAHTQPQITEIQYLPYAVSSRHELLRTQLGSYLKSLLQIMLGVIAGVSLVKLPSWLLPEPLIQPVLGELTNNPLIKGAFPVSELAGETSAAIGIGGTLKGSLPTQDGHFQASFAPPPAMIPVAMDRFYLAPNASSTPNQTTGMNSMVVVDRFYFPNLANPGGVSQESSGPTGQSATIIPAAEPFQNPTELSSVVADNGLPATEGASSDAYVLAGVMELGNQSTALFHQGNHTYSIRLGEEIGASNWVLASITAGRALLKQGGETRVLRVGEALLIPVGN